MTNHPTRTIDAEWRYAFVSPRGFQNEFKVWKVPASDTQAVAELQEWIDVHSADSNQHGGDAYWFRPSPKQARFAIDWADRQFVR
jgi:hypothetical protein